MENAGQGPGVWKTWDVESAGCGKHSVWKARGLVENTGWKTQGLSAKHEVHVKNTGKLLFAMAVGLTSYHALEDKFTERKYC